MFRSFVDTLRVSDVILDDTRFRQGQRWDTHPGRIDTVLVSCVLHLLVRKRKDPR